MLAAIKFKRAYWNLPKARRFLRKHGWFDTKFDGYHGDFFTYNISKKEYFEMAKDKNKKKDDENDQKKVVFRSVYLNSNRTILLVVGVRC